MFFHYPTMKRTIYLCFLFKQSVVLVFCPVLFCYCFLIKGQHFSELKKTQKTNLIQTCPSGNDQVLDIAIGDCLVNRENQVLAGIILFHVLLCLVCKGVEVALFKLCYLTFICVMYPRHLQESDSPNTGSTGMLGFSRATCRSQIGHLKTSQMAMALELHP